MPFEYRPLQPESSITQLEIVHNGSEPMKTSVDKLSIVTRDDESV